MLAILLFSPFLSGNFFQSLPASGFCFWGIVLSRHSSSRCFCSIRSSDLPIRTRSSSETRVLSYKTCLDTKPVLHQDRFGIFYRGYKTGFVPKTDQYKTCIVSNTKIEASIWATKPKPWQSQLTFETVEILIQNEKAGLVSMQSLFWCGRFMVGAKPVLVRQV